MEVIEALTAAVPSVIAIGSQVVGVMATVAAVTPNTATSTWIGALLKLINCIGMNVGKAKNQ